MYNTEQLIKLLNDGVNEVYHSANYQDYLKFLSHFHDYSPNNSLLIYMQKPEATLVTGYKTWQRLYNRHVKRGEKAIHILAPMKFLDADDNEIIHYKRICVYDVSQTEGDPLPSFMSDKFTGSVENMPILLKGLEDISPVAITYKSLKEGVHGYYHHKDKVIVIDNDMSEAQTIKTIMHEIAHALLHGEDKEKNRKTRELEAESTAYIVCSHFNIDTSSYSFPYIASWAKDQTDAMLKSSMRDIIDTADKMIFALRKHLEKALT